MKVTELCQSKVYELVLFFPSPFFLPSCSRDWSVPAELLFDIVRVPRAPSSELPDKVEHTACFDPHPCMLGKRESEVGWVVSQGVCITLDFQKGSVAEPRASSVPFEELRDLPRGSLKKQRRQQKSTSKIPHCLARRVHVHNLPGERVLKGGEKWRGEREAGVSHTGVKTGVERWEGDITAPCGTTSAFAAGPCSNSSTHTHTHTRSCTYICTRARSSSSSSSSSCLSMAAASVITRAQKVKAIAKKNNVSTAGTKPHIRQKHRSLCSSHPT